VEDSENLGKFITIFYRKWFPTKNKAEKLNAISFTLNKQTGIKQEVKNIIIEAEAFDITVELKFPENNQENMLDFGAVRVGDLKD